LLINQAEVKNLLRQYLANAEEKTIELRAEANVKDGESIMRSLVRAVGAQMSNPK
jgi:hypothetical protein